MDTILLPILLVAGIGLVLGLGLAIALAIVATYIKYYIWTMVITFSLTIKQMIKNSFQFVLHLTRSKCVYFLGADYITNKLRQNLI